MVARAVATVAAVAYDDLVLVGDDACRCAAAAVTCTL